MSCVALPDYNVLSVASDGTPLSIMQTAQLGARIDSALGRVRAAIRDTERRTVTRASTGGEAPLRKTG
jgi:hypothetical protein